MIIAQVLCIVKEVCYNMVIGGGILKSYRIADLLTLIRMLGSLSLAWIVSPLVAFIVFGLLFFTDFLDGVAALKWPDPRKKQRWYNRLPVSFDNVADIALFVGGAAWIITQEVWVIMDLYVVGGIVIVFLITRAFQDSPKVHEPLKTYMATACMWAFGLLVMYEIVVMIRATNLFILWPIVLIVSTTVVIMRGKRNINSADKR